MKKKECLRASPGSTLSVRGAIFAAADRKSVWPRRHRRDRSQVVCMGQGMSCDIMLPSDLDRQASLQTRIAGVPKDLESYQDVLVGCPVWSFNVEKETAQAVTCCRQCAVVLTCFAIRTRFKQSEWSKVFALIPQPWLPSPPTGAPNLCRELQDQETLDLDSCQMRIRV